MKRSNPSPRPLTWDALAGLLGVQPRRLYEMRAAHNAPTTTDAAAWIQFQLRHSPRSVAKRAASMTAAERVAQAFLIEFEILANRAGELLPGRPTRRLAASMRKAWDEGLPVLRQDLSYAPELAANLLEQASLIRERALEIAAEDAPRAKAVPRQAKAVAEADGETRRQPGAADPTATLPAVPPPESGAAADPQPTEPRP